jgi:hypothetical protein
MKSFLLPSATALLGALLAGNVLAADLPPPEATAVDREAYRCWRWSQKCAWRWGAATWRYDRCMRRHGC